MTSIERTPPPASHAPPALLHGAARIAAMLRRSVVAVAVGCRRGRGRGRGGSGGGMAAGIVWHPGLVVTNDHVARAGRSRPATMHIEPALEGSNTGPLETGPSETGPLEALAPFEARARPAPRPRGARDARLSRAAGGQDARRHQPLRTGELVVVVGHPWHERGAFSASVVLTTADPAAEHTVPLAETVRPDLRLAPGNSGGPLADARGRVVGVNSMIAGGSAVAIPSEAVERFLACLDASGHGSAAMAEHSPGFLGIATRAVPLGSAGPLVGRAGPLGEAGAVHDGPRCCSPRSSRAARPRQPACCRATCCWQSARRAAWRR